MPGEVRVPVRLEVIQSSINTVKAAMDSLKPNSSGWRELQKILQSMQKEANNLQITMSKPFSSQSQFTQAEKGINKLENALDQARLTMSRIDFSDLKLDTNQQAIFDGFKRQLQDIQNEAKTFKASLKQSLQMSDAWEGIQKLDPNTATHSFDEIIKAVENKVKTLQKNMQDAQKAFDNFQPKLKSAKFAEQFASNKDNSFKAAMGEDFSKFFVNGDQLKFKSGQKNPFYQFIQENLQLDSSQIEAIKQAKTRDLEQIFKDLDLSKILSQAKGTISEGQNKQANLNNANVAYEEAQRTSIALGQSLDSLRAKEDELQQKTNQVNSGLQQFEANTANAARNSTSFSNGVTQANQGLEGMRNQLKQSNAELMKYQRTMSNINSLKMTVTNFMGFTQVLNIVKKGVREAIQHIHELDDVMNGISVVTNMSTGDLWDQIDAYSDMASKYGVSIKGAYEVSRIYYQQGLETADVMTLTNETLKLAKISGLDYATTTDYMTTALRGFKMEMSDAGRVVDVYSNLAAHTAVSSEELAVAMSKTASSMESVGSTFEESSAMIATMVAVTRESATNIGSALKSIAARYGEMKSDPTALKDLEGEALSYNKVDAALQSVGISLKDSQGEFRNMTDVVLELAEVWDQLDSTQQRYIATQFAGNRQQSRFLALVSNKELLKANLGYAQDSEGTGDIQAEKTLDSITSKLEQAKVAYQEFYTSIGLEDIFKGALDGVKDYINYLNRLPKVFGDIPIAAIGMVMNLINAFKLIGQGLLTGLGKVFDRIIPVEKISNDLSTGVREGVEQGVQAASSILQRSMGEAAQGASNTIKDVIASNGQNPPTLTTTEQLQDQLKKSDGYNELMTQVKNINFNPTQNISSQIESQLSQILQTIIQTKPQIAEAFASAGDDAIAGFVNHLVSGIGQVQNASQQLGHGAVNTLGDSIEAHSPSEATGRLGDYFVEGFLNHIADQLNEGFSKGEQLGKTTLDGLSSTVEPEQFEKVRSKVITGLEKLNPDSDQFAYNDEVKAIKGFGKHKKREALRQEYRDRYNQEKEAAQNATYEQYANGQLTQGMFADVINRVGIGRQQLGDQTVVKQLMRSQYKGTDQFKEIEKIGVGMNFTSELQRMVDAQNWMSPVGADMLKTLNELPRRRDEMTAAIQARAEALYEGNKADFLLGGGRAIKDFSPKEIEDLISKKRNEGKFSNRDEQIERGAYELVQQRQIKETEEEKQKSIEVAKAKEEGDKDAQAREAERIAREQRESRQNFMGIQSGFISAAMGDRTQPKSDVAGEVTARIEAIKAEAQNKPVEIPTKVSPPSEQSVQEAKTDAQNKVNAEPPIEQPIKVQATNELQSQFNKLKANYNTSFTELQNANLGQATAQMAIQNSVGSDTSKKKERELNNNLKKARAVVAEKEAAQKAQAGRLTDFAAAHPEFQSQVDAILGIKKGEEGKSAAPTSSNAEALKEEAAAAEQAKTAIESKKEVESSTDTSGTDAGTTALKEQTEAANADTEALKEKNIAQNDGGNIPPSGPSSGPPSGPPLGPTQTFDDVERGMIHNAQSYQYDMTGEWGIPQTQPQPAVSDAQYLQALQQLQSARQLESTFEGEYSDEEWNQIVSAKNEAIKLKINPDIDEAELQAKINELKAKIEGETPAKVPVKAEISEQGSQRVAQDAQRVAQNAQLKTMQSKLQAAGFGNDDPTKEQKKAIMQAIKEREKADRDAARGGGRISSKMHIFQGGVAKAQAKANERAQVAQNNVMQATQNAGLGAMNITTVEELNQALERQKNIRTELQALETAQSNANVIQGKLTAVQAYNDALEQQKQGQMSQEQVDQARQAALSSGFTERQLDTGHLSSTIEQLQAASNRAAGAVQEHATNLQNEINAQHEAANGSRELANAHRREAQEARQHRTKMGGVVKGLSSIMSMATMFIDKESEEGQKISGAMTAASGVMNIAGGFMTGGWVGGLMSIATSAPMIFSGLQQLFHQETESERLGKALEKAEERSKSSAEKAAKSRSTAKNLESELDRLNELQKTRYDSTAARDEYQAAVDQLAETFPELITGFDEMGHAILSNVEATKKLTEAQREAAFDQYDASTDKANEEAIRYQKMRADSPYGAINEYRDESDFMTYDWDDWARNRGDSKSKEQLVSTMTYGGKAAYEVIDDANSKDKLRVLSKAIGDSEFQKYKDLTDEERKAAYTQYMKMSSREREKKYGKDADNFTQEEFDNFNEHIGSIMSKLSEFNKIDDVEKRLELLGQVRAEMSDLNENEVTWLNNNVFGLDDDNAIKFTERLDSEFEYYNKLNRQRQAVMNIQEQSVRDWQQYQLKGDTSNHYDYLENGSALQGLISYGYAKKIMDKKIGKNYDPSKSVNGEGSTYGWFATIGEDLFAETGASRQDSLINQVEAFYDSLNTQEREMLEKMLTESDKYSIEDYSAAFSDKLNDAVYDTLQQKLNEYAIDIKNNMTSAMKAYGINNENIRNIFQNKTDTYLEQDVVGTFLKKYRELQEHGLEAGAENYLSASANLYSAIENLDTTEARNKALELVKKYGVSTEEDLANILAAIDQDETLAPIRGQVEQLMEYTHTNVALGLQASISNLSDNWKTTMDTLSKAVKGVGVDEMDSIINQAKAVGMEISESDFTVSGGTLMLSQEKYLELVNNTIAGLDKTRQGYLKRLQDASSVMEALDASLAGADLTDDQKNLMSEASLADAFVAVGLNYEDYIIKEEGTNKVLGYDNEKALAELREAWFNTYGEYQQFDFMLNQMYSEATTSLLKSGDFTAILTTGFKDNTDKFSHLIKLASKDLEFSEDELKDLNVKETVKGIQSAYNKLLSDILSKGIENIDWTDYDYITKDLTYEQFGLNDRSTNKQFAIALSKATGATIAEANDLIVKAIEKDNAQISETILSSLNFISDNTFTADLDNLKELANTFGMPIQVLLQYYDEASEQATMSLNSLEYLIREYTDYKDFDIGSIKNFRDTIQESVDSLFSSLTSDIKKGIEGSADYKGIKNIQEFLDTRGIKLNLQYTKMKSGYKLARESAEELYQVLKQIDDISAQIVLDDLNDSLEESLTNVKELDGALKDIARIRAGTESDQFKFMENKIPSGQNNPINYFQNLQKMYSTIDASAKNKHLMDYTDFYNILTEMGNLAAAGGTEIQLGAGKFVTDAKSAAALIEEGAGYLTVAADGSIQVDLSRFGIDFLASASTMKEGISKGVTEIAKGQVEMLDGAIKLLETIVAIEDLGNIDHDSNGIFNIMDIFEGGIKDIADSDFTKDWNDARQKLVKDAAEGTELRASLEQFKVNGLSLFEILSMDIDSLKEAATNGKLSLEQYGNLMTSLIAMAKSGDYDLNNLIGSLNEILGGTNFEGTIDLNENEQLVFTKGVSYKVKLDDQGKPAEYWVGSNKFTSAEAATRAATIGYISALENASVEYDQDTGEAIYLTNKGTIAVNYEYNTDASQSKFTATLDGKEIASGSTRQELDMALKAYAVANETQFGAQGSEVSGKEGPQMASFSVLVEGAGMVDFVMNLETGDVQYNYQGIDEKLTDAEKAELQRIQQEAAKNGAVINVEDQKQSIYEEREAGVKAKIQKAAGEVSKQRGTVSENNGTGGDNGSGGDNGDVNQGIKAEPNEIPDKLVENQNAGKQNPVTQPIQLGEGGDETGAAIQAHVANTTPATVNIQCTEDTAETAINNDIELSKAINVIQTKIQHYGTDGLKPALEHDTVLADALRTIETELGISEDNLVNVLTERQTQADKLVETLAKIKVGEIPIATTITDNKTGAAERFSSTAPMTSREKKFNTGVFDDKTGAVERFLSTTPTTAKKEESITGVFDNQTGAAERFSLAAPTASKKEESTTSVFDNQTGAVERFLSEAPTISKEEESNTDALNDLTEAVEHASSSEEEPNNAAPIHMGTQDRDNLPSGNSLDYAFITFPEDERYGNYSGRSFGYAGSDGPLGKAVYEITGKENEPFNWIDEEQKLGQDELNDLSMIVREGFESIGIETEDYIYTNLQWLEALATSDLDIKYTPKTVDNSESSGDKQEANITAKTEEVEVEDPSVEVEAQAPEVDVANTTVPVTAKVTEVVYNYSSGGRHYGGNYSGMVTQEKATGNFAMAQGTLMGELGPELVVSNGHYFVAGQNGAEFVDLDSDAIVFNHLQTASLLKNGMSKTRGKAITNERVATSFAKGNVNGGPAQASASQALAALKELRNQWQAIADLDPSKAAQTGGGGGGGGDPKAFLKDLEKWYNWLQQIAQLEKEITYEETKRSKIQSDMIAHGQDYHKSQMETLKALQQQLVVHQSLTDSQYEYFEKRRKELNEQSAFSALYGFGESGQLYYKDGALAWLSDLSGRNATTGEANYTAEEQYKRLVDAGFEFAMKYDSSGNEIKQEGEDWYSTALQAFWDKMDADKEEMQSLHDSVEEHRNAVLESQASINEIIRDIEDNQINVEQKVLKAIEDSRQREIDEFQKERDAIEKSSKALIDGLSEQLNLEKEMYSNQQEADEFGKLQRQLAILQRSGGSASQITDLQRQISEKQQNMYFDAQQQQIDALQKASDNQLERLDHQIEIMTEQLEYEKENGLLWNAVYEVLQGSPESISEFIKENTIEYWGQSPTELTKTIREDLFEIQRFKELQETLDGGLDILTTLYGDEVAKKKAEKEKKEAEEKAKAEGNFAASTANSGGNGGGNTNNNNNNKGIVSSAIAVAKTMTNGIVQTMTGHILRSALPFASGGMDYATGPAILHGTSSRPEAVLNASQTATLRNDILSNKPTSLLSLLTDFRDAYNNISNATNSVIGPSDGGIIIENATVEMNVSQIANDYDAQRAGEQALDRMVQIARKSQGWNRIGG